MKKSKTKAKHNRSKEMAKSPATKTKRRAPLKMKQRRKQNGTASAKKVVVHDQISVMPVAVAAPEPAKQITPFLFWPTLTLPLAMMEVWWGTDQRCA